MPGAVEPEVVYGSDGGETFADDIAKICKMTAASVLPQSSVVCMFSSVRMTPRKLSNGLYNLLPSQKNHAPSPTPL